MGFKAYLDTKDNQITTIDELVRVMSGRCDVVAIAKCDKVTFNGGKYGYKWSVQQLKVYTSTSRLNTYAFIEDSDDEEAAEAKPSHDHENQVNDSEEDEVDAADSDDESEEESDEEEEVVIPSPKKKSRKKRLLKKKN